MQLTWDFGGRAYADSLRVAHPLLVRPGCFCLLLVDLVLFGVATCFVTSALAASSVWRGDMFCYQRLGRRSRAADRMAQPRFVVWLAGCKGHELRRRTSAGPRVALQFSEAAMEFLEHPGDADADADVQQADA